VPDHRVLNDERVQRRLNEQVNRVRFLRACHRVDGPLNNCSHHLASHPGWCRLGVDARVRGTASSNHAPAPITRRIRSDLRGNRPSAGACDTARDQEIRDSSTSFDIDRFESTPGRHMILPIALLLYPR
jgi:hypothetical protein